MLSKVTSSTIFGVFGMTRPGIELRSPGSLANILTIMPIVCNISTMTSNASERHELLLTDQSEICSLGWNETGILPRCNHVRTTVWLHLLGSYETHKEKGRCGLSKDASCCLEQILEVAHYKIAAVRPLTSHLTSHPSKTSKTRWVLLAK